MEEEDVLKEVAAMAERYLVIKGEIEGLEGDSKRLRESIQSAVSGMLTGPGESMTVEGIMITLVKGRESERFTRESLVRAGAVPALIERAAMQTVGEPSLRIMRAKDEKA